MCIFWATVGATSDLFQEDGVFVRRRDEVRRVSAVWQLVVVATPPTRPAVRGWTEGIRKAMHHPNETGWWRELEIDHWEHRMVELNNRVEQRNNAMRAPSRIRRSPFDFIGAGASWLFGLTTRDQLTEVARAVSRGDLRTEALTHNQELMLTMLNHTRDVQISIADNLNKVNSFAQEAAKLATRLNFQMQTLERAIKIGIAVDEVAAAVALFERACDNFDNLRAQVGAGILTEQLLNRRHMHSALNAAKAAGFGTLPIRWYYANALVNEIREDRNKLTYAVALPMIAQDRYILYDISYLPVRLGDGHLRYVTGASQVAVNTGRRSSFLPDDCVGVRPMVCRPREESTETTCEVALVTGGNPKECEISIRRQSQLSATVLAPDEGTEITAIAPHVVLLKVGVLCPGKQTVEIGVRKPVLIKLPAACRLETDGWVLNSVVIKEMTVRVEMVQPELNLPPLNISWPDQVHDEWNNQMKMVPELKVPLLNIGGIVTVPHGYVSKTGYNAVFIVLAIVAAMFCILGVNVLLGHKFYKRSQNRLKSAMRDSAKSGKGTRSKNKKKPEKVLRFQEIGDTVAVRDEPNTLWLSSPEVN